jgi:hypothetical protein
MPYTLGTGDHMTKNFVICTAHPMFLGQKDQWGYDESGMQFGWRKQEIRNDFW